MQKVEENELEVLRKQNFGEQHEDKRQERMENRMHGREKRKESIDIRIR